MLNRGNIKKGETIVEVMISMTILALLMFSVYSLVSYSVQFQVSSRNRTQASQAGQKGLNNYLQTLQAGCSLGLAADNLILSKSPSTCYSSGTYTGNLTAYATNNVCNIVFVQDLTPDEQDSINDVNPGDSVAFSKIVSEIHWVDRRLGDQTYQVSEIVRK